MNRVLVIPLSMLTLAFTAVASENKVPNCKLTIRTINKSGQADLELKELYAVDRAACKKMAKDLQKNPDPNKIEKITVTYKWIIEE